MRPEMNVEYRAAIECAGMSEAMILLSSLIASANDSLAGRKSSPRKSEQKPLLVDAGRRRCGVIDESEHLSTR